MTGALFREEEQRDTAVSPTIIMIFGGAGDLSWRKLVASLFDRHHDGRMPKKFDIIAVDRLPLARAGLGRRTGCSPVTGTSGDLLDRFGREILDDVRAILHFTGQGIP